MAKIYFINKEDRLFKEVINHQSFKKFINFIINKKDDYSFRDFRNITINDFTLRYLNGNTVENGLMVRYWGNDLNVNGDQICSRIEELIIKTVSEK